MDQSFELGQVEGRNALLTSDTRISPSCGESRGSSDDSLVEPSSHKALTGNECSTSDTCETNQSSQCQ